ncbi:transcriptional regulator ATRX homolog isoform X2 [Tribolium castaneum]|uniref:Helicase ARIP4-like Protein n=1 Tax=Tribolium castaneum TaxID=7070 RepID=D6WP72_TRICA|nr:PREDICTED: transcriptional regulator ATRX homolog isoform X2 [Tribolium castaneum]EFA07270.2 Helicase ARIP4-like Protein [Tribolium castaneum]|eukprot:XP_008193779.1 PREDICTED: transcriptional regulator ATRX homolog isoform X2 [Tribolium castaneum]
MMESSCSELQKVLVDVLSDLKYMSTQVIKKSDKLLNDVESLNPSSVEPLAQNFKTLIERININVGEFVNTFNSAFETYKKADEAEKSKTASSLKTREDLPEVKAVTQETDIDLVCDIDSNAQLPGTSGTLDIPTVDIQDDKSDDGSETDCDEPTLRNFDIPLADGSVDDVAGELKKALDELTSQDETKHEIRHHFETASFDFDDVDEQLTVAIEKAKDSPGRGQEDNHELLDLLNKAVDDSDVDLITKGDQALQILEEDMSLSSCQDSFSDDSLSDDDNSDNEVNRKNEDNVEDFCSSVAAEDCQNFSLKLRRIDSSDGEIDRLCNTDTLKRKCKKITARHRKKKYRRLIPLDSSSSSSSSEDENSSDGSVTPDLIIDEQRPSSPVFGDDAENEALAALADNLVDRLDSGESSSDSDTTEEEEPAKKKRKMTPENMDESKNVKTTTEDKDTSSSSLDEETIPKRKSWKNDPLLRSSSSDSDSDADSLVFHVRDKRTKDNTDLNENVVKVNNNSDKRNVVEIENLDSDQESISENKNEIKVANNNFETMIITDSSDSSSDSDDVLIVEDETGGTKGRRNIRAILSDDELNELTQQAKNEENERIMRLAEHSKNIESIQSQHEDFILDFDVKTGEPLVTVDHKLAKMLKPHQKSGIQFMWEACYESVEILKTKPGSGCILAHCMGLGKTLQVITLIHTLFTHPVTKTKHVLVVCPLSTVINWKNEFKKAFKQLDNPPDIYPYWIIKGDISEKINIIHTWRQTGGVLILGYDAYQIITNEKTALRITAVEKQRALEALVDPGPDLIVCDEGHQLKNGKTLKTQALMKVKTKRRIVLTGTPLQNNLKEYYFMVQFVKPHLLGTYLEYTNRFASPIMNGQFHDSTPGDIKLMKKRTHVLTKMLKNTIHRVEGSVLSTYLPEITDYTIFIKLTPLQIDLYTRYIDLVTGQASNLSSTFFHDVRMTNFCNLHPYALHLHYSKPTLKRKAKTAGLIENLEGDDNNVEHIRADWYKNLLPADVSTNINYSTKIKLILDIISECMRNNEKVLIFGQYLVELDIVEHFLKQFRNWRPNVDYYRMDGDTSVENRDILCKKFNSNPTSKVFLLTHKVGGLGLNLTGANRVILIGSNHNPSHDSQSLYRVYRFGQERKCYVYRLVSLGTMEEKIYHRCVLKLSISGTVVDKLHFDRRYKTTDLKEMYKYDFDKYNSERPIPAVPSDMLMALLLKNCPDIFGYHLHNALLENRPEEELTDEDKKLAWDEFNNLAEAARTNAPNPPNIPNLVLNPMSTNTRGFVPKTQGPSTPNNPFVNLLLGRIGLENGELKKIMSDRFKMTMANKTPTTGEFNYALNKFI